MEKKINVGENVQSANKEIADVTRKVLNKRGVWCLNVMSSPGSGKTTLLEETIRRLKEEYSIGVIVGDIQTDQDAKRLAAAGAAKSEQIETNGACHLTGTTVRHFLRKFDLEKIDIMIIENIGNLVCPISWDLGEHARAILISIPEGDDKPSKYPNCCIHTDALLITKIDTHAAFNFDIERAESDAKRLNPNLITFRLSAKTGDGMDNWINWLKTQISAFSTKHKK